MGLFSTKQTQKIDQTTMPVAPQWASDSISDLVRRAQEQSNVDPYTRVAPINSLTDLAAEGAAGLGAGTGGNIAEARDMLRSTLAAGPSGYTAASLLEGLDKYENEYLGDVIDSSLAGFDDQAGQQRASLSLGLAGRRGGSGADLATALTEGQLGLARGQLESGLRFNAKDRAFDLSNLDANRRQSASADNARFADAFSGQRMAAARSLADLATLEDANARANQGFQADLGTLYRGQEQEIMDAPWTNLERLATIQGASGMENLFGERTTGKTTTKSSGGLGNLLLANAIKGASMIAGGGG